MRFLTAHGNDKKRLENAITDFSKEAQALFNNSNPTIEKYKEVVDLYNYDLSADLPSEELRQRLESQLQDIKNSYEITEEKKRIC
jgi:hypothetical protein